MNILFTLICIVAITVGSHLFVKYAISKAWTAEKMKKELMVGFACVLAVGFLDIFISGGFIDGSLSLVLNYSIFTFFSNLRWHSHFN